MRYEIISTVDLGKAYAILIRDNETNKEWVINSTNLNRYDSDLKLFLKARMFFIRSGAHDNS